jgi:hypothetical protein
VNSDELPSELAFPVEAAHVMMFARALGDREATWGGQRTDSPPVTFPAAVAQFDPEYELRPRKGQRWFGSGATSGRPRPSASAGTRLHAEQHYTYARPLRIGEVLVARRRRGASWEKRGGRGGNLSFTETITEFLDDSGAVVVSARGVSVTTSKIVSTEVAP